MSSGSTGGRRHGGGDANTIISPNTSFGDIIKDLVIECFTKIYK